MGEGREESSSKTITRDDGGALAPLPPVSLSLGLPPLRSRRGLRSQRRPGRLSPPPALPAPRPSRSLLSLSPARGSSGARGRGGDSPLPGKYRSPRTPTPGGGAARPGPARRAAATRPGAERRPLPAASSRGGFCKSHKMARAPNLRSEKRRGPSGGGGGGGGSSARRARTARPRVPAQTDRHSHTLTHTRAHTRPRTRSLTHTLSHSHRSRPLAGGGSGTNSSSRNSSSSSRSGGGGGGGARTPRSGCPLPEPDLGRDQQQRRQQSPRIPPPLLPPPPPPHSNGAFYYYSGGKRKGLKKNQPTKWRRKIGRAHV